MGFPINPNIPAAGNNPSNDQPIMQENFANINSYLQVDHTNPVDSDAGEHKQVTFAENNVPALPTIPPVLFTNTVAGNPVPQLYYYSGIDTGSSEQYSTPTASSGNYSTMALGGIVIKFGTVVISSATAGSQPVTFTNPFPNNLVTVNVTVNNTKITTPPTYPIPAISVFVSTLATTGFGVYFLNNTGGSATVYWVAIGN
jgi:hypothetical protein